MLLSSITAEYQAKFGRLSFVLQGVTIFLEPVKAVADWAITIVFGAWILYALLRAFHVVGVAEKRLEGEKAALDAIRTNPDFLLGKNKPAEAIENSMAFSALRASRQEGVWDGEYLTYTAWIQPARYAAGVFVFIGLLGTVLGIAFSLSSLGSLASGGGSEAATADQLQTVLRSVGAILSGMKTASICTVLGIAATLFLSHRNNKYLMFAGTVVEKAERVWRDVVRGDYVEAQNAGRHLEQERQVVALDKVYRRLEDQLTTNLTRANRENSHTLSVAVQDMGAAFTQATERLNGSVASLTENINLSANQLSEASDTAARVAETLEAVRGKLETSATVLSDTMAEGYAQLKQIQNLVGESARIITVGHEKLSGVAASLETVVTRVGDDRAETLHALTEDRTQTLEALRQDREQMLETVTADRQQLFLNLQDVFKTAENDRASALLAVEASLKRLTDTSAREREALAARSDALLTTIASEREEFGRVVRAELVRSQNIAHTAMQEASRLQDILSAEHKIAQERSDTLLSGLQGTDERLNDLLTQFETTLTQVAALSEHAQLHAIVAKVAEKLDATQKATTAGATALRNAALAASNAAAAQQETQENLNAQSRGWRDAQEALAKLQFMVGETVQTTARVVAASEKAAEQLAFFTEQQAHDRSNLINALWSIEASLGHNAVESPMLGNESETQEAGENREA